jgi:hypothetical protein
MGSSPRMTVEERFNLSGTRNPPYGASVNNHAP